MLNLNLSKCNLFKAFFALSLFSISFTTSAVVSYQSISNEYFINMYPGDPTASNDIYWQGPGGDIDIDPSIAGANTIGSSVFGITTDSFNNISFSFQNSIQSFSSNLVIGLNEYSSVIGQNEFFNFQDGLFPELQTLTPGLTSAVTINENNTANFSLFTQTDRFLAESNSIAGFYLNAGQDPNSIFSDASLFQGLDPFFTGVGFVDIQQQGVIDQFNFLIDEIVDPTWQSLAVYYWKADSIGIDGFTPDATSYTSGSFVSYDLGSNITASVPEPSTYMLLGLGMLSLVGFSRKKQKAYMQ